MPGPPPKAASRQARTATPAPTSAHHSAPAARPPCPAACAGKPKPLGARIGTTWFPGSPAHRMRRWCNGG
jgi:hypothetical protein